MKKILVINDYGYNAGGASIVALQSAIGLKKQGYDVTFFCGSEPIDKTLVNSSIQIVCLKQANLRDSKNKFLALFQGLWNIKAAKVLNSLIDDSQNIVALVHSYSKTLSPSVFSVLQKRKVKTILILHDYFAACPNGGFQNYHKKINCNLKPLSCKCILCNCDSENYIIKLYRCLRQVVLKHIFLRPNYFYAYAVSEYSQQLMRPYVEKYFKELGVLMNPVQFDGEENVDVSKNQKYIYIGRLSEEKGIADFCKVISDLNLEGIVLGDGGLMEKLKHQYPEIDFKGWVQGKDKLQFVKQAKCLILPSRVRETFGLVVPEMLGMGIPCIVPSQCGATYLIKDGYNGYVFEMDNYESLKNCVLKIENSKNSKFSQYINQSDIRSMFSFDRYIANLTSIIDNL